MRSTIAAGILAVGMLAGCGGAEPETMQESGAEAAEAVRSPIYEEFEDSFEHKDEAVDGDMLPCSPSQWGIAKDHMYKYHPGATIVLCSYSPKRNMIVYRYGYLPD